MIDGLLANGMKVDVLPTANDTMTESTKRPVPEEGQPYNNIPALELLGTVFS